MATIPAPPRPVQMPGTPLLALGFASIAAALIVAAACGVWIASRACGETIETSRRLVRRFALAALAWTALLVGAAAGGFLARWDSTPPPFALLPAGIVVLGVVIARSRAGDRLARGLPMAALVGYQAFRLPLELLMHRAYTDGVMPVQMSYSGRNLDIVTGSTAAVLAIALILRPLPRAVLLAWNVMGLALLANIVGIAVLSTPPIHYFGPDRLNTFVAWPPYVLLPGIMVLAAWAGHLIIFRALRLPSGGGKLARGGRH